MNAQRRTRSGSSNARDLWKERAAAADRGEFSEGTSAEMMARVRARVERDAVLGEGGVMTDQDVARNMRSVAHAVAQQELEGLTVPAATTNDTRLNFTDLAKERLRRAF